MASNLVINGTTYSGVPTSPATPRKPDAISVEVKKIGVALVMANGTRRWVNRGTKRAWTVEWKGAREATRAALRTLHQLTTTFAFIDELGVTYATCQTEETDLSEAYAYTDPSNNLYYDLSIVIREA